MFSDSAKQIDPAWDRGFLRRAVATCALSLACAIALPAMLMPPGAHAAVVPDHTYTVSSCRAEDGSPISTQAWHLNTPVTGIDGLSAGDTCGQAGGYMQLALNPPGPTAASDFYRFDAPLNTSIVGYKLYRSLSAAPAGDPISLYDFAAYVRERVAALVSTDYGCDSLGGACANAGDPNALDQPVNLFEQHAPNLQSLQVGIGCVSEICAAPADFFAARARIFRSQVTLSDNVAPLVLAKTGSLLGPAAASGTALLRVGTSDLGGGIASASASIDGGFVRNWSAGDSFPDCNQPYTAPQPCPLFTEASFAFDTAALADGPHQVSGSVTDAAGNSTPFGPLSFTVTNANGQGVGSQSTGNGSPSVTTPVLTFKAASLVRPRGTNTAASGLLSTQAGEPIAGATLTVRSVQLATDKLEEQALPDVVTAKDGSFTVPVKSDGAQLLRVEFTPSPGAAVTASASVSVRTETAISFKTSKTKLKRGHKVTLSGALLGAGQSAGGTTASIQAIVRGKWRPVGAADVNDDGSFKWSYKFVALNRTTVFSFRAVVVRTPGWPWPTTISDRLKVKVTP
jgi:hypothetical protein